MFQVLDGPKLTSLQTLELMINNIKNTYKKKTYSKWKFKINKQACNLENEKLDATNWSPMHKIDLNYKHKMGMRKEQKHMTYKGQSTIDKIKAPLMTHKKHQSQLA
jgi:hypothetical protein